ncbi:MAG: DUF6537 domain-containing protein [Sphingomonadaceae bacterium]|nr:DUF6537 domain-containing protein [Sphingomonadaceae bacterium]
MSESSLQGSGTGALHRGEGLVLRISIHALGGQGGGVLADWIVEMAENAGWTAQATSVPGVAQRTGATVYYLEIAPPGPAPVMALMPSPGDVDVVLAAELMEAGRAIARGLVTPGRTTLIASSHRVFAIAEKSAPGDGRLSAARVIEAAERSSKRLVLADLAALADAERSVISATLFGALAGSGALPFDRMAFEGAIRRGGKGVERSLAAFAAACNVASGIDVPDTAGAPGAHVPPPAQSLARLGDERLRDHSDATYARLYRERLDAVARADSELGGAAEDFALTAAAARHLALWMAYEDVVRVADLKTRAGRFDRIAAEARARDGQVVQVSEYLSPRFDELCDLLPAGLGRRVRGSARARRWAGALTGGRTVTTTRLPGFLLMWGLARLRRWRPRTLRYAEEQARITAWLESAVNAARTDYALGVEVLRLQRLVKGYSDTHARGLAKFAAIMGVLPGLAARSDGAERLRALAAAALADEEGAALRAELERLAAEPAAVRALAEV